MDFIVAAGFEDCSFIQYNVTHERIEEAFRSFKYRLCLALGENERKNKLLLVTGSYDQSIIVWKVNIIKHNRAKSEIIMVLNKHWNYHWFIKKRNMIQR